MRTLLFSICTVLAFGAGCVTGDGLYLPGELDGFGLGEGGGNEMDCMLQVDAVPAIGTIASHIVVRSVTAPDRRAERRGGRSDSVGFNTGYCESLTSD